MSIKDIFKKKKDKETSKVQENKVVSETKTTSEKPAKPVKETKKESTTVKASKTKTVLGVRVKIDPDKENGGVYYLSPHGDKGWKIMKQGGSKPLFVYETKAEAMKKARELGRQTKSAVIVKGKDGKIKESLNYKDKD